MTAAVESEDARSAERARADDERSTPRRGGWGGWRPGAGRKPGLRPRVRRQRAPFPPGTPCHVTLYVRSDVPSLRDPRVRRAIERSLEPVLVQEDFRVRRWALRPDRMHLLVEADGVDALTRAMRGICARVARAVNRAAARKGPVLDDRYAHRPLPTAREVREALAAWRARKPARAAPPASAARRVSASR